jgi:DNA-binding PucR family transcriptional regulator
LSDAPNGLRLARIAMLSATAASPVAVFGDDLIGAASVASGELLGPLTRSILAGLDVLSTDERDLLLLTFRTWVDQGGSATAAGAAIYCHPNTVRYRLRKLEELTGRSVSDPRSMVELLLAAEAEQRRAATT